MFSRSLSRLCLVAAGLALIAGPFAGAQDSNKRGRKYKAPPPTARIEVTVLKDTNGKPLENAAVVFHTLNESGNMELKSNEDGKAMIDVLPIGDTMRLQVIAKGYQTYGGDYKIDNDAMVIEVRMKRPGEQYSIYKAHPENETKDSDPDKKDQDKKDQDKKDQDKPAEKPPQ
jgi:hypothetical protein